MHQQKKLAAGLIIAIVLPVVCWFFISNQLDHRVARIIAEKATSIEKIFFHQNQPYLDKSHHNYLKLNLQQQLIYSKVDLLGLWHQNGQEIISVGDQKLLVLVDSFLSDNRTPGEISFAGSRFHVGRRQIVGGDSFFIYTIRLDTLVSEFTQIKIYIAGSLIALSWLFVAFLFFISFPSSTELPPTPLQRGPTQIALVRQTLNVFFNETRQAVRQLDALTTKKTPTLIEQQNFHNTQVINAARSLAKLIDETEILSLPAELITGPIDVRDAISAVLTELNLDTATYDGNLLYVLQDLPNVAVSGCKLHLHKLLRLIIQSCQSISRGQNSVIIKAICDPEQFRVSFCIDHVNKAQDQVFNVHSYLAKILAENVENTLTTQTEEDAITINLSLQTIHDGQLPLYATCH